MKCYDDYMGWFSFKNKNDDKSNTEAVSEPVATFHYTDEQVREQIRSGQASEQLRSFERILLTFPSPYEYRRHAKQFWPQQYSEFGVTRHWPKNQSLANTLLSFADAISDIDVDRSRASNLLAVTKICNEAIPRIFRKQELKNSQGYTYTEKFEEELKPVINELGKHLEYLPTHRSTLGVKVTNGNIVSKLFPTIDNYADNKELYELLTAIKQDWLRANELPLNPEDEHLIEQIGASYLKDSLRLYDQFCRRTGTQNGKALVILTEQLTLIHQQILFVLEQNAQNAMNTMESHTEFLKAKNLKLGTTKSELDIK